MNAIVTYGDMSVIENIKYLVGALRSTGQWDGDIVVILINPTIEAVKEFENKGCIVEIRPKIESIWACKYFVFDNYMYKYSKILYMDPDFIIYKRIGVIFGHAYDKPFMWDQEPFKVHDWLKDGFASQLGISEDKLGFNAGSFVFDPAAVGGMARTGLFELHKALLPYNCHNDSTESDQTVLNVYFKQFTLSENIYPNKCICFDSVKDENTIAGHTTRWYAPWVRDEHKSVHKAAMEAWAAL